MADTVRVTYNRKFTVRNGDNFEHIELGGETELSLGDDADLEVAKAAYDRVYEEFSALIETKAQEALKRLGATTPATAEEVESEEEPRDDAPIQPKDKMSKWIKETVDRNTDAIRDRVLPGEKFTKPPATGQRPQAQRESVSTDTIVEGEAVAFDNVKVFHDNSQTKKGKTARGTSFAMLRLGDRGVIPGDYVTGKSFDPEIVPQIEEIIDRKVQKVDVYGYFQPRNNDPDVFDLVIQGVAEAAR